MPEHIYVFLTRSRIWSPMKKAPYKQKNKATLENLHRVPEDESRVANGDLAPMALMGGAPGRASGEIYVSLRERERRAGGGYAFPDNVGFGVNLPNRGSFSPDAAFYTGELKGGQFLDGAPIFRRSQERERLWFDGGARYGGQTS